MLMSLPFMYIPIDAVTVTTVIPKGIILKKVDLIGVYTRMRAFGRSRRHYYYRIKLGICKNKLQKDDNFNILHNIHKICA